MQVGAALARLLCHLFGYIYPAYQTFKAIQSNDEAAHTQWLTFWIVNTYFTIFELFSDYFLSTVIPFYYEAKIGLLIWLVAPQFMGAAIIYRKVIAPYMQQYEQDIDVGVEKLQAKSTEAIGEIGRRSIRHLKHHSTEVVKKGIAQIVTAALKEQGTEILRENLRENAQGALRPKTVSVQMEVELEEEEKDWDGQNKVLTAKESLDLRDIDLDKLDDRLASFMEKDDEEDDDQ